MVVTFPHLGNTYICIKGMLDDLGMEYIIPPFNNKKALEMGTKISPEMACLPLKLTLGNFIQAYHQGADTILMAGGQGPCRFGYYCEMQREILNDAGYAMDLITLEMPDKNIKDFLGRIKKLTGTLNVYKIGKIIRNVAKAAVETDELERLTYWTRPREIEKGMTDRIYNQFRENILSVKGSDNIREFLSQTKNKLENIDVNKQYNPLKIGMVGEIYTTIDSYTSFNIDIKLGNMSVEVDRNVTVSGWIVDHIIKNAFKLPRDLSYVEAAKPYLKTMIGGHAQETIGNTVLYSRKGYDGVIQIYPLTCMPEIVAESILPSVERDFGIPVLTLIIDEMTGEAGYLTRIEAFIDLLKRRRERGVIERRGVLSWN